MGAITPEVLAALEPYKRQGRGYDRWTVKRAYLDDVEPQDPGRTLAGLTDWGDDAPWTDSDLEAA
jgi:hypothetical protein